VSLVNIFDQSLCAIRISMLIIHSDCCPKSHYPSPDALGHQVLHKICTNSFLSSSLSLSLSLSLPSLCSLICILSHACAVSTHFKYLETSVLYLPAAIICVLWLYCGQKPHSKASHYDNTKTRGVHYNIVRIGLVHTLSRPLVQPFDSVPWERSYDGSTRFLPLLWHLRLATISSYRRD